MLNDLLLKLAEKYEWRLQAWAVFSNHYHFVALSPPDPATLRTLIRHLHSESAREVNKLDGTPGRKVWHQFWDTQLTYERSYLARLHYVHTNAVHHRMVVNAVDYPYCSAASFERNASATEQRKVASFAASAEKANVFDDFEDPQWDGAGAGQAPRI